MSQLVGAGVRWDERGIPGSCHVGDEVRTMFNVSRHMVYYWINNKYVTARKTPANTFLIKITPEDKIQILERIESSCKAKYMTQSN